MILSRATSKLVIAALCVWIFASCAQDGGGGGGTPVQPIAAYCPYLPSKTFGGGSTITGHAFYEYRENGNGNISTGKHTFTTVLALNGAKWEAVFSGLKTRDASGTTPIVGNVTVTATCANIAGCSAADGATAFAAAFNASALGTTFTAEASSSNFTISPKKKGDSYAVGTFTKITDSTVTPDPNPIRRTEVVAYNAAGVIVNCAETDEDGYFNFQIPAGTHKIAVQSRANNGYNTAYVMNDPTNNVPYQLSETVSATTYLRLIASATSAGIEGGAFNILDQIYNAQKYMRTTTAGCATTFAACSPFVTAPVVKTYWKAGVSPGIYQGISGAISFYLNTKMELYILGGLNGDTNSADMDHYDNSVIVHEYGHFVEDQFARPDSPGGSHNGNGIIDPRLAWGEGWANFFQATVLDKSVYRDTYGRNDCTGAGTSGHTSCYGVAFNEDLAPATCGTASGGGMTSMDCPVNAGEGNFREFSVSRALWDAVHKTGGSFAEVWTAFNSPTVGMKVVGDRFKTIGRLHTIQQALAGKTDWAADVRTPEKQNELQNYGTPLKNSGCSATSMTVARSGSDNGTFEKSNQLTNNDFYYYSHPGGPFIGKLEWSGGDQADLDLFLYREGYTFGSLSSMAGYSNAETTGTSGSEQISVNLPAGNYMLNVFAYTGLYSTTASRTTSYTLTINGTQNCGNP